MCSCVHECAHTHTHTLICLTVHEHMKARAQLKGKQRSCSCERAGTYGPQLQDGCSSRIWSERVALGRKWRAFPVNHKRGSYPIKIRGYPWVKNLPASAGDAGKWVWFLGQEDPLGQGMATHSSTLAWKIPWTHEPRGLQSMGSQRVKHDWATEHAHTALLS